MTERAQTQQAEGADDLEILHPERELEIAGVKVVMREYGFVEGMRLAPTATPIIDGIKQLALSPGTAADAAAASLDYSAIESVFAANIDLVLELVAQACDQPLDWVRALGPDDGESLVFLWWAVNGPFFVRRLMRDLVMRMARLQPDGVSSTPSSPPPATATPNSSAPSRVVN